MRAEQQCAGSSSLPGTAGTRTALTGTSGAGKTTLGRALAGLTPATGGAVRHDGRRLATAVERRGPEDLRAVQYVHQDGRASFDEFRDVLGQLADTARRLRGVSRGEAVAEAAGLACRLGLDPEDLARRPGGLSGGQLQRASLVRASTARPALLVCEEATSALDVVSTRRVLDVLAEDSDRHGTALLLITHDPDTVRPYVHRSAVVRDGRLSDQGQTDVERSGATRSGAERSGAERAAGEAG